MTSMRRIAPVFLESESGSVLIEAAISLPFLLILLLGVVELGGYIWQCVQITDAVEAGVLYAIKNGWCTATGNDGSCTSNTGAQITTAQQNAGISSVTMPTGVPACVYSCSETASGFSSDGSCGTSGGSGSPPPKCANNAVPRQYVHIGANIPRLSLITGGTALLNLTLPDTITMTTWVRVQ